MKLCAVDEMKTLNSWELHFSKTPRNVRQLPIFSSALKDDSIPNEHNLVVLGGYESVAQHWEEDFFLIFIPKAFFVRVFRHSNKLFIAHIVISDSDKNFEILCCLLLPHENAAVQSCKNSFYETMFWIFLYTHPKCPKNLYCANVFMPIFVLLAFKCFQVLQP